MIGATRLALEERRAHALDLYAATNYTSDGFTKHLAELVYKPEPDQ